MVLAPGPLASGDPLASPRPRPEAPRSVPSSAQPLPCPAPGTDVIFLFEEATTEFWVCPPSPGLPRSPPPEGPVGSPWDRAAPIPPCPPPKTSLQEGFSAPVVTRFLAVFSSLPATEHK